MSLRYLLSALLLILFVHSCVLDNREKLQALVTEHPESDLAILHQSKPWLYRHLVRDSLAGLLIDIKQEQYYQSYSLSLDSIANTLPESYRPQTALDHELVLAYCRQQRRNPSGMEDRLNQVRGHRKALSDDHLDRYYDLRYGLVESEILYQQSRTTECFATLYAGLHVMAVDNEPFMKDLLWDKYLRSIIVLGSKEPDCASYYDINQDLLRLWRDTSTFAYDQSRRYVLDIMPDSLLGPTSKWKQLLAISHTKVDSLSCYLNLGYHTMSQGHIDEAIKHYQSISHLYEAGSCSFYTHIASQIVASLSDLPTEKLYGLPTYCPDYMLNPFYDLPRETLAEKIQIRQTASRIFGGKSTLHLGDFYTRNTVGILNVLDEAADPARLVIELFDDTRRRERERQLYAWSTSSKTVDSEDIYARINDYLTACESFRTLLPLDHKAYRDLRSLLLTVDDSSIDLVLEDTKPAQWVDSLLTEPYVINVLRTDSTYHYYQVDDGNFSIGHISAGAWDQAVDSLMQAIGQQSDLDSFITQLQHLLRQAGWDLNRRISLIADGTMQTLPWELLTQQEVHRYTSASQLSVQAVDAVSSAALCAYSSPSTLSGREQLQYRELPSSYEEVQKIADLIPHASTYAGYDLTTRNLQKALTKDLLHLATHAEVNSKNRLENYIVVREDKKSIPYFAYRLARSDQQPKVAILSTCYSGTGQHVIGAGIFSIAKVLQAAGSQAVVKSLWAVNDAATRDLMQALYGYWSEGLPLSAALRQAKTEIRHEKSTAHPYFWAGFVLEGNGEVYLSL